MPLGQGHTNFSCHAINLLRSAQLIFGHLATCFVLYGSLISEKAQRTYSLSTDCFTIVRYYYPWCSNTMHTLTQRTPTHIHTHGRTLWSVDFYRINVSGIESLPLQGLLSSLSYNNYVLEGGKTAKKLKCLKGVKFGGWKMNKLPEIPHSKIVLTKTARRLGQIKMCRLIFCNFVRET